MSGYNEDWLRTNAICFESLNADSGQTDEQAYKNALTDLNRLLGLKARWEKRTEKVFVLTKTGDLNRFKSKKTFTLVEHDTGVEHYTMKGNLHQFRDVQVAIIAARLNEEPGNPYVFDETGYTERIDIDMKVASFSDIPAVRKALQAYGLDLKEEERLVDKFVFTETTPGGLLIDAKMQAAGKAKIYAQKDMGNPTEAENNAFLIANKKKPGVVTLASGLQYKIIKPGKGPKPLLTDRVLVHFTGTLVNGRIFDSSYQSGRPFSTRVTDVLKGWQEALPMMPVGSKWIIYVPSALAYGEHTSQGKFPPNSNMIFEIELLDINKCIAMKNCLEIININKYSITPKYQQLANAIVSGIKSGTIVKDEILPSLHKCCITLDISKNSVEKAYNALKNQVIVGSVKGKGYYVLKNRI